jgi:hypothetical protein
MVQQEENIQVSAAVKCVHVRAAHSSAVRRTEGLQKLSYSTCSRGTRLDSSMT